jgi:hypothetical protein
MADSSLLLAQERRQRRADELLTERVEYVLDRVGLSEERCIELSNADRVGPDARKKLKGILNHYRGMAHPWTACVRDNTKRFGPEGAKKVCSVLTDLEKGTTKWRKGLKKMHAADVVLDCPLLDDEIAALLEHVDTNALAELLSEGD